MNTKPNNLPARPGDIDLGRLDSAINSVPMLIDGEKAIFTSSSFGGRKAFYDLMRAFRRGAVENPGALPVVELREESYSHKQWGTLWRPLLPIVRWVGGGKPQGNVVEFGGKPAGFDKSPDPPSHDGPGFDDEIPF